VQNRYQKINKTKGIKFSERIVDFWLLKHYQKLLKQIFLELNEVCEL